VTTRRALQAAGLGVEPDLLTSLLRQQRRFSSLGELNPALREGLAEHSVEEGPYCRCRARLQTGSNSTCLVDWQVR